MNQPSLQPEQQQQLSFVQLCANKNAQVQVRSKSLTHLEQQQQSFGSFAQIVPN